AKPALDHGRRKASAPRRGRELVYVEHLFSPETNSHPEALKVLMHCLKSPDPNVASIAAFKLGDIGEAPAVSVPALINALTNGVTSEVRTAAACALLGFGPDARAAVPDLTRALSQGDPVLREAAYYSLALIDPHSQTNARAR